ncbi:MAG: hypothetical protein PHS73_00640 [Candidatus Peribacteraceae bacterium]|nr:hypothetical protein [Candidatus Peribacteraceae bacterium]
MRNPFIITGLSFLFLGTMATSALAETAPAVQPNDGFLEQPKAIFMDAPEVPASLYPTLLQQVRAVNLLIHQEDELPIGSPAYKNAHRLLVSNLRMLERQLYFNPVDLARFNATTHPARSTIDQTIYSRDDAPGVFDPAIGIASSRTGYHTYTGDIPTRRSIVIAYENRTRLHALAMAQ